MPNPSNNNQGPDPLIRTAPRSTSSSGIAETSKGLQQGPLHFIARCHTRPRPTAESILLSIGRLFESTSNLPIRGTVLLTMPLKPGAAPLSMKSDLPPKALRLRCTGRVTADNPSRFLNPADSEATQSELTSLLFSRPVPPTLPSLFSCSSRPGLMLHHARSSGQV